MRIGLQAGHVRRQVQIDLADKAPVPGVLDSGSDQQSPEPG
jgi:hypothetical protein